MNNNIAVFLEIYNEEKRLRSVLENFKWAKEIVVLNKSSTDQSAKIAQHFTEKVFTIPYGEVSDHSIDFIRQYKTECEWYFFITASSLISPKLVSKIIGLTGDKTFKYKVIALPFKIYILGVNDKHSPWNRDFKEVLIKKEALVLNKKVHHEVSHAEKKIYRILPAINSGYFFHCSNESVDELILKHMRYAKNEVLQLDLSPKKAKLQFAKASLGVLLKKRTYLLAHNGFALCLGFLSYYVLRYLYAWEHSKTSFQDYEELRENLQREWAGSPEDSK